MNKAKINSERKAINRCVYGYMIQKYGKEFQFGSDQILIEFAKDQCHEFVGKKDLKNWLSSVYREGKHPIVVKGSKFYYTTPKKEAVKSKSMDYHDYLKSPEWRLLKSEIVKERGSACQLCLKKVGLELHHMSYKRLGKEDKRDVLLVCRSCHSYIHKKH